LDEVRARALAGVVREILADAAGVNINEELGVALVRLGRLYDVARAAGDGRLQLGALKEIHAIIGLYAPPRVEIPPEPEVTPLERAVTEYLGPLKLLPANMPLVDHVRVAAARLIDGVPLDLPTDEAPG
jgi:hypothetical protein